MYLVWHTLKWVLLLFRMIWHLMKTARLCSSYCDVPQWSKVSKKWLKRFTHWDIISREFWLWFHLENFLYELESCLRYVKYRPNSGLSNGTKIITLGLLEKFGHPYFKKRHPQTPFASYFSMFFFINMMTRCHALKRISHFDSKILWMLHYRNLH